MKPTGPAGSRRDNTAVDALLLRIVDGGLAACIFIVPLLMGGRQAAGQLALVLVAVAVAAAWTLRQCLRREAFWRSSSVELLLVAGVVLLLVQMAPLSQAMLTRLSPQAARILPLWSAEGDPSTGLGSWSCISLTPSATRAALSLFLAYGLLFLVTVQRIRVIEDVERLLRWIALSAVLMAAFGLVQLLASNVTGNAKFFGFYEHPFSGTEHVAKGSFTNRNHFAHFLALGIGPLIWWLQHHLAGRRGPGSALARFGRGFQGGRSLSGLRTVALGVVLFAALLSLSRGGAVAMLLAAAICVVVCWRAKTLGIRFVLSLAAVAVLIGTLLTIDGYRRVNDRLDTLTAGSLDEIDQDAGRRTIWAAVLKAIPDYALLGAGVGSHREVYPMYLEDPPATEYTHAESGYLQVALETGVVGLVLLLAGIGFLVFWSVGGLIRARSSRLLVCIGAVSASLAASLLHSCADFVWYVPACTALVAVLAACACRAWQLARGEAGKPVHRVALPKLAAMAATLVVAAVGLWMIIGRVGPALAQPHWDRYRIMALAAEVPKPTDQDDAETSTSAGAENASLDGVDRMICELELVVARDSSNARAHLRLAAAYVGRFDLQQQTAAAEIGMPLAQLRDATIQSRSAVRNEAEQLGLSADEKEQMHRKVEVWLSQRLTGQGSYLQQALQHTLQGLRLCPLQGEGYLYLAQLHFLEGPHVGAAKSVYVHQALTVRPYDGAVLLEAGREAVLAGDLERGMEYWRRSFHCGRKSQRQLVELLAGRIPVSALLETFQPDVHAARRLHLRYRELAKPQNLEILYQLYAQTIQAQGGTIGDADAAQRWLEGELSQLRRHLVRMVEAVAQNRRGKEAANAWLEAVWLCRLLGDGGQALWYAENASRCDSNHFEARYALGKCLAEQRQFAEAESHLKWCLHRRPNDQKLKRKIREVVRGRIDNQGDPIYHGRAPGRLR